MDIFERHAMQLRRALKSNGQSEMDFEYLKTYKKKKAAKKRRKETEANDCSSKRDDCYLDTTGRGKIGYEIVAVCGISEWEVDEVIYDTYEEAKRSRDKYQKEYERDERDEDEDSRTKLRIDKVLADDGAIDVIKEDV